MGVEGLLTSDSRTRPPPWGWFSVGLLGIGLQMPSQLRHGGALCFAPASSPKCHKPTWHGCHHIVTTTVWLRTRSELPAESHLPAGVNSRTKSVPPTSSVCSMQASKPSGGSLATEFQREGAGAEGERVSGSAEKAPSGAALQAVPNGTR